jgi:hypothetical protein
VVSRIENEDTKSKVQLRRPDSVLMALHVASSTINLNVRPIVLRTISATLWPRTPLTKPARIAQSRGFLSALHFV